MVTAPELEKQPYRIACGTVWGGIKPVSLDVCTKGVTVSLHSTASRGDRGGDIYQRMHRRFADAHVRSGCARAWRAGQRNQLVDIPKPAGQDELGRLRGGTVRPQPNGSQAGSLAITTAPVVSYDISNSTLYYSYAGHPPDLARRSGGPWLPLVLKTPAGQANLPLGVFRSVRYDQGEERVQAGDGIVLYTDGLSEAMSPEFGEKEFLALLEARADVELATVRDSLVEAVTAFSGGPILTDDCTLMVVEVR